MDNKKLKYILGFYQVILLGKKDSNAVLACWLRFVANAPMSMRKGRGEVDEVGYCPNIARSAE